MTSEDRKSLQSKHPLVYGLDIAYIHNICTYMFVCNDETVLVLKRLVQNNYVAQLFDMTGNDNLQRLMDM